jgi:hypothetical protein
LPSADSAFTVRRGALRVVERESPMCTPALSQNCPRPSGGSIFRQKGFQLFVAGGVSGRVQSDRFAVR